MAVTKTLIRAVPQEDANNDVQQWDLEIRYENDSSGDATYYTSIFSEVFVASTGAFTAAAKGTFNLEALIAICPTSAWDTIFDSQVDSVITNPLATRVADLDFQVPTE